MILKILFYIFYLIFPKQENIYIKDHIINTTYIPQYIYWIDGNNVLLSSYGNTIIYNVNNRGKNIIDTCDSCIYGYDNGLVYCKYEHRDISSIDEYSSTINIYDDNNNLLFSKDIFPTVVPIICKRDLVILKSAYSFLEQNTYLLDINNLKEIESLKSKNYFFNIDKDILIILDEYNRLWVYEKNTKTKKLF